MKENLEIISSGLNTAFHVGKVNGEVHSGFVTKSLPRQAQAQDPLHTVTGWFSFGVLFFSARDNCL